MVTFTPDGSKILTANEGEPRMGYSAAGAVDPIVTGLSKNTFGAANAVTREQAVTMLWRFAKQQGFDTTQGGMAIREFDDYDSLSEYAREAMAWAVNAGILKGSGNRLMPDADCTRAQLVTLLYRLESQTR